MLIDEFKYRFKNKIKYYIKWLTSLVMSFFNRKKYKNISYFCFFIGYPRSGHTLIASLLDAHPNIVFGIELDAIQYYKLGFNRDQIIYSLIKKSKDFTEKDKNMWTNYSYRIKDTHQGTYEKLKIIGDKYAGQGTLWLKENIYIFDDFSNKIKIPIKLIHVIRNPFDTITTMVKRQYEEGKITDLYNFELLRIIYNYFDRVRIIDKLKKTKAYDIFDLYHEDFIKNPYQGTNDLINFLGETASHEYLVKCSGIVHDQPHRSRFEINWPQELIEFVEKFIKDYDFLKNYSYS